MALHVNVSCGGKIGDCWIWGPLVVKIISKTQRKEISGTNFWFWRWMRSRVISETDARRGLLVTDAHNKIGYLDGCTQRSFGQRMRARYGWANPRCAQPASRMWATSLIFFPWKWGKKSEHSNNRLQSCRIAGANVFVICNTLRVFLATFIILKFRPRKWHLFATIEYQGEVICVLWSWPWQTSRHRVGSCEDNIGKKVPRMNI